MVDIRQIDLNLLVALDALLAEGGVTRAAKRLHLSQPAASAILAKLRQHFNDPLLLRTQHGMELTERAKELLGPVRQVLAEAERLVQPRPPFDPATAGPASAPVEVMTATPDFGRSWFERSEIARNDRPELTAAKIIVSGGRALGSSEQFDKVLAPLADRLGAALGASRAAGKLPPLKFAET